MKVSRDKALQKKRRCRWLSRVKKVNPNQAVYARAVKCLKGESGYEKWKHLTVDSEGPEAWLDQVDDSDVTSTANWILELRSHWKRLSYQQFAGAIAGQLGLFDVEKQEKELLIFTRFLQLFDRAFLKHWLIALRGIKALLWGQDSVGKALILALYAFSFIIENPSIPFGFEPQRAKRRIPLRIRPPIQPNAPSFLA